MAVPRLKSEPSLLKAGQNRLETVLKKYFEGPKREWWELPPVFLRVHERRIRQRIDRLMGPEPTRLTDKGYMRRLEDRLYEAYVEDAEERIRAREEKERLRTKRLVLEGIMPVQPGSDLEDHPIFRVRRRIEKDMKEILLKEEASRCKRKPAKFEFEVLDERVMMNSWVEFKSISLPSFLSQDSSLHFDMLREEVEKSASKVEEETRGLYLFERLEDLDAIRYHPPSLALIDQSKTVEEMYAVGEKILQEKKDYKEESEESKS